MHYLENKNILIVGANSGIGNAIAKKLVAENVNTFTASRRKPDLENITHLEYDVLGNEEIHSEDLTDSIDGLVYCPGTINLKPFSRISINTFEEDLKVNYLGAVKTIQQLLPKLKKSSGSSVVLFSTVAVQTGMNFHASIAGAKGAIEGLCRSLSAEYASENIRFNAIAPSLTDTPLASRLLSSEEKKEASAKRHPLKRVGNPEEVADLSCFLLSNASSWITGQIIKIDGGISSLRSI